MVRIAISVEGETEGRFVAQMLQPHLQKLDIYITAINIKGNVSIDKISGELNKLIHNFDFVTTFYDFYGFRGNAGETKASLEYEILKTIEERYRYRVIPYIQMYEFEALLFSSPDAIWSILQDKDLSDWAETILGEFNNNPETINDSPQTAPSKRLIKKIPSYKKIIHGPNIAKEIGLENICKKCAGFASWLDKIENLAE